ncbi:hypothetical protein LTR37_016062 [Vermiconidia calcicola]|uniref:Uncharacterized protein n=1 Tax=Vermiconidia calcicola TaxID=1690605 RepID=A0ACC3MQD8_9PEZI|nr:hypothetical protein LTR37_016062 [Vermiconidia calcicola]
MPDTTGNDSLNELREVIRTCPVIDNHAHNLLRPHGLKTGNLLTITTEASGDALEDTPTSLAHLRAVRQLRQLYDLPAGADWTAILEKRARLLETDADSLTRKCLEGTQTILVDDGLSSGDTIEPYSWHHKFTLSPCKRIVRIETLASDILSALHQQDKLPVGVAPADEEACSLGWVTFITAFEQAIAAAVENPEVVGFKSVICYRTGLDIEVRRDIDISEDGLRSFRRHFLPECVARNFRVETKGMNDALVISTCKLIAAGYRQRDIAKPLQFHTGLGDNDINLLDSNPGCLQPLIAAFPTVPIVLLHSSYPYTREAGYLATVYKNCYLDIGEVFPMVSRDGQEKILRQSLELTPWSKLLWSTDGHFFPETYWLANVQGREAMEKVLCEYVEREDLTVGQAVKAVKGMLFENSNNLYSLGLKMDNNKHALPERRKEEVQSQVEDKSPSPRRTTTVLPYTKAEHTAMQVSSRYKPAYDRKYTPFIQANPNAKFIFIQWLDYLGLLRSRCMPINEFQRFLETDSQLKVTTGNLGTLQNDYPSPVCNPVGAICVEPDLSLDSLRPMQSLGRVKDASTIIARYTDEEGKALDLCPRSSLDQLVNVFAEEFELDFLIGFEIEITFCKRNNARTPDEDPFSPIGTNHAWGTISDEQYFTSYTLMLEITTALQDIGVGIQQMHSESGAGQYEFVLPPLPPIRAVDTLVQARQCIQQIAAHCNLRATCHPMPFPGIGTAAHAHISFNRGGVPHPDFEKLEMHFMASVLEHMRALCVFTMPQAVSYSRVAGDSWTGGTWIAWGTQNREVPLRKSGYLRWEVRCLDGCANMYLALAAVFAAGLVGVRGGVEMRWRDCLSNPTKLSAQEKEEHGITTTLPRSLDEAIEAAEQDSELEQAMSPGMLKHFLAMKKAEQEMLNEMPEKERRVWLMERY